MRLPIIIVVIFVSTETVCDHAKSEGGYKANGKAYQSLHRQYVSPSQEKKAQDHQQNALKSPAAGSTKLTGTSARFFPYSNPAQYANNEGYTAGSAKMDASGMAEVRLQVDLHLLMEKLDRIPLIERSLIVLNSKLDHLLNRANNAGDVGQIARQQQIVLAKLQEQENLSKAALECCQQTSAKVDAMSQLLYHIQKMATAIRASGFGGQRCDVAPLDARINRLITLLTSLTDTIRRMNSRLDLAPLLTQASKNFGLTEQALSILHQIQQPGYLCPEGKSQSAKMEQHILQYLTSIITTLQRIPQTMAASWTTWQKAQVNPMLLSMRKLQQWIEHTASQVTVLKSALENRTADIKRFFRENQKSLTAVRKVVTQTTELVQQSAAAASAAVATASRSLCHKGKIGDDLQD